MVYRQTSKIVETHWFIDNYLALHDGFKFPNAENLNYFLEIFIAFHNDESHFSSFRQTFIVLKRQDSMTNNNYFNFALVCVFCGLYNINLIYLKIDLQISELIKGKFLRARLKQRVSFKNTPDTGVLC